MGFRNGMTRRVRQYCSQCILDLDNSCRGSHLLRLDIVDDRRIQVHVEHNGRT